MRDDLTQTDLHPITAKTGYNMGSICLEFLQRRRHHGALERFASRGSILQHVHVCSWIFGNGLSVWPDARTGRASSSRLGTFALTLKNSVVYAVNCPVLAIKPWPSWPAVGPAWRITPFASVAGEQAAPGNFLGNRPSVCLIAPCLTRFPRQFLI